MGIKFSKKSKSFPRFNNFFEVSRRTLEFNKYKKKPFAVNALMSKCHVEFCGKSFRSRVRVKIDKKLTDFRGFNSTNFLSF